MLDNTTNALGLTTDKSPLSLWLSLIGIIAMVNSFQSFVSMYATRRLYGRDPTNLVTPLCARTFGTWTFTAGCVRLFAASRLHVDGWYDMTLLTFVIALSHFASEIFVFNTADLAAPIIIPVIVSGFTTVWMLAVRSTFV